MRVNRRLDCRSRGEHLLFSPARREAQDERLGQSSLLHTSLNGGNVVRDAPEFDGRGGEIGDGESGAGVAIARLTNGPGIEKILGGRFDAKQGKGIARAGPKVEYGNLIIAEGKASLHVSVPEEGDGSGGIDQGIDGLDGTEDIFILIAKSAVDEGEALEGNGAGRQLKKEGLVGGSELGTGPKSGDASDGIEILGVFDAAGGLIVIAANGENGKGLEAV